jgi:3-deoxy-D-manno-octulosonate 8-phosphate phosphatase (KDO 8-P phosphatase)
MGDDEPDVPLLERAGFSACPADATPAAKKAARVVLRRDGGRGAVREFVELVLAKNGGRAKRSRT